MWHFGQDGIEPYVTIDSDPVVIALLARPIWDAIVASTEPPTATDGELLTTALNELLRAPDVAWTPPGFGKNGTNDLQHFDEMIEYLERAPVDWRDHPAIQTESISRRSLGRCCSTSGRATKRT
jgi:hypothetical protein